MKRYLLMDAVPSYDFIYLVVTGMPGDRYRYHQSDAPPFDLNRGGWAGGGEKKKTANVGKKEDIVVCFRFDSAVFS